MPVSQNPFLGSLGEVLRGIGSEIMNPPARQAIKLENQIRQARLDDMHTQNLEEGRRKGYEEEFWNQVRGVTMPTIVDAQPGDGGVTSRPPDTFTASLEQPELQRLGTLGGVFSMEGLMRANEGRLGREENAAYRMDQARFNAGARADAASARFAQDRSMQQQRQMYELQQLDMDHQNKLMLLQAKQNDPVQAALIQSQIDQNRARRDLLAGQLGLVQAQTSNVASGRPMNGTGGGQPAMINFSELSKIGENLRASVGPELWDMLPAETRIQIGQEVAEEQQRTRNSGTALSSVLGRREFTPGENRWFRPDIPSSSTMLGQPMSNAAQAPAVAPPAAAPASGRVEASPQAIEYLRANPELAGEFMRKYGYLPEGF